MSSQAHRLSGASVAVRRSPYLYKKLRETQKYDGVYSNGQTKLGDIDSGMISQDCIDPESMEVDGTGREEDLRRIRWKKKEYA
jgi:hypothetical protein